MYFYQIGATAGICMALSIARINPVRKASTYFFEMFWFTFPIAGAGIPAEGNRYDICSRKQVLSTDQESLGGLS